jgi:hypothetical protein
MKKSKILKLGILIYIIISIISTLIFVITEDYNVEQKLTIFSVFSIFIVISSIIFYLFINFFINKIN